MIRIAFACPKCGKPVEGALEPATAAMTCRACGETTALPEAATLPAAPRLAPCCVCGSPDLYSQKDFNRGLGIVLAAVGLALGPFTHWISAVAAVAIDAGLYLVVPTVGICYACNAQYRGFPKEQAPPGFDIAVHDAYKFDRRNPPRREAAVAGPLAKRLRSRGPSPT